MLSRVMSSMLVAKLLFVSALVMSSGNAHAGIHAGAFVRVGPVAVGANVNIGRPWGYRRAYYGGHFRRPCCYRAYRRHCGRRYY